MGLSQHEGEIKQRFEFLFPESDFYFHVPTDIYETEIYKIRNETVYSLYNVGQSHMKTSVLMVTTANNIAKQCTPPDVAKNVDRFMHQRINYSMNKINLPATDIKTGGVPHEHHKILVGVESF